MILITIMTTHGCIEAILDDQAAPATCENFVRYCVADAYTDGAFWRTVTTQPDNQPGQDIKIDVIQATCRADGWGFAAFGQVICGMDVVRRIQMAPTVKQTLTPSIAIHGISVRSIA